MRVPDEYLSSVFFLGLDTSHDDVPEIHYAGTGFYFWLDNEFDPSLGRLYFVTARHSIERAQGAAGSLFVRLNTEDGRSVRTEIDKYEWAFHDDATVDIAAVAITFTGTDPRTVEHARLHRDSCLTAARIKEHNIGIGSETTVIGMFRPRPGDVRNIPVVRSGVIAAMPGEPIYDETAPSEPFTAYLVEVLSLGGLSGSPVFVHTLAGRDHRHPTRQTGPARVETWTEWNQGTFLLGVVRSHYDEPPPAPDDRRPRSEWINKGIAAVTPIEAVLEVLDYEEFKKDRREDAQKAKAQRTATLG
jgi:hypothetical protein